MSRMRTLKPGFFCNEDLVAIPPLGRLLFAGLWCLADREGRMEDRPARIKIQLLPADDADVDDLLNQLATREFIVRYEFANQRYIQIVNFSKHQKPSPREAPSTIPEPPEHCQSTALSVPEHVLGTAEDALSSVSLSSVFGLRSSEPGGVADTLDERTSSSKQNDPVGPEGPGKHVRTRVSRAESSEPDQNFEHFYALYPRHEAKERAWRNWKARLKGGEQAEQILRAAENYALYCRERGVDREHTLLASTFVGVDRRYRDWVSGSPRASPNGTASEPKGMAGLREWMRQHDVEGEL